MKNHLVILGGMGPQASLQLHKLLLSADTSIGMGPEDYPFILHASMPVPDFIASDERTADAVQLIQTTSSQLPLENARAVGMACNTAHLLLDQLTNIPRHNFVSMIESVVQDAAIQGVKTVGLLATPFTIQNRLYHDAFEKKGVSVLQPTDEQISVLDHLIHEVIAGKDAQKLRPQLSEIGDTLVDKGAEAIVLGCTELPLIGVDCAVPAFDSLSSLARHMVRNKV